MDGNEINSASSLNHGNFTPKMIGRGKLYHGDSIEIMASLQPESFQTIIADPPYFQVLLEHEWDNSWENSDDYLQWTSKWVRGCKNLLKPDGLFYIFGQLGKREHVWLELCAQVTKILQFHDMIIWDRAVGYNDRKDSFTPQYEMILVLRKSLESEVYFNKDAVRIPYDQETITKYMRDKRYKDLEARHDHLQKGKFATNIMRIPSLKGRSTEKIGHPSQKPVALIETLIMASTRQNDFVLDPFMGSGTTAEAAEKLQRNWVGIEKNTEFLDMTIKRIAD